MTTQLMLATRLGEEPNQAVATGGMLLGDGVGQLDPMQTTKRRHRLLGGAIGVAHGIGYLVQLLLEGVVDQPLLRGPAPHQRQVLLVHPTGGKRLGQGPGHGGIEGKQQHP
ncbi:hypothetical protein D3C85_1533980 [compost metagenome]